MNERDGVVLKGTGGVWTVRADDGETMNVSMRGRLKRESARDTSRDATGDATRAPMRRGSRSDESDRTLKLSVGDRVTISRDDTESTWAIDVIHKRRSQLARRNPSGARGERVVVANVDQVLVVFAAARPEPHPRMLDRFLVIAEANGLAARVVVNKCDLASADAVRERFAEQIAVGYPFHFTSVVQGTGLDELRAELADRNSALTGPSGVGKSSLMNTLFPGLDLRTAEISESVNKGRHTTVGAVLHPLPNGNFVADTPGLREVGLWGIDVAHLAECFPEFLPFLYDCRFGDCRHLVEPGCAIRDAVAAGAIFTGRYESYKTLREDLEEGQADSW